MEEREILLEDRMTISLNYRNPSYYDLILKFYKQLAQQDGSGQSGGHQHEIFLIFSIIFLSIFQKACSILPITAKVTGWSQEKRMRRVFLNAEIKQHEGRKTKSFEDHIDFTKTSILEKPDAYVFVCTCSFLFLSSGALLLSLVTAFSILHASIFFLFPLNRKI